MYKGKFDILGLKLAVSDSDYLIEKLKSHLKNKKKLIIGPLPVNQVLIAYFDANFRKILNSFTYLVPDGMWVKKSLNFLYNVKLEDRIRGTNLILSVCRVAEKEGFSLFLYGSTDLVLQSLKHNLLTKFPLLKISGYHSPPFSELTENDELFLISKLKKLKVKILLIALGTPKQEKFAYEIINHNLLTGMPLAIFPVGAVFDFLSGTKAEAPIKLQNTGFEWLFRLVQEPKRLWKRYLLYNPIFLILIFVQRINLYINRTQDNAI